MTLYEISHIRQSNRSLNKRWFTCREMNLIVWFRRNMPVSFQLTFNNNGQEQTINWAQQRGFSLHLNNLAKKGFFHRQKTPLLVNYCDQKDLALVRREFLVACENIEVGITDFIYARLMEYPSLSSRPRASQIDHPVVR